ncbi:MAG TPA: hypothetical protein VFZ16_09090 [Hyphomicrobiaceae bacterium]|nr:hypothetical protein [Hyphomicrobiaceae bacterium]
MPQPTLQDPVGYHHPVQADARHAAAPAWPLLLPLALMALASLVIDWPWLSGRVTIPWDAKAGFLPQIQFLAQSLASGDSPFWTPFVFSGHPQIADPQSFVFSLPYLLLALVSAAPSAWAADATQLAVVLLGGMALMLWCRDQGWHWGGALIAALAFCYGASMAWRIQHTGQVFTLSYLPMVLLFLDRALARRSLLCGAAAGFAAAMLVLGRDQVALLSVYLLAGFTLWRLLRTERPLAELRATLLPLSTAAVVGLVVIVVPVLLTLLLAAESNRAAIDYIGAGRGSLHPALLMSAFVPELYLPSTQMADYWGPPSAVWGAGVYLAQNMGQVYIGAIPLLLLLLAGARGMLWEREVRFYTIAGAAMLLYALGWYTPVFRIFYEVLPGVDLYRRPADATFTIGALAAILAGYAAHRLLSEPQTAWTRKDVVVATATVLGAFGIAIGLAAWMGQLGHLPVPLAAAVVSYAGAALVLTVARRRAVLQPMLAASALAAFTVADLAYNNGPNGATALPTAHYDVLDPASRNAIIALLKEKVVQNETRRDRIELAGLGFHWPNASLTHRLENTLGYNPLRLGVYSKATGAIDTVGLPEQREFAPLFPSYHSTLADLLGLRFIATGIEVEKMDRHLEPGDLKLVARTADGFVYENPQAMDRVLFATDARQADFAQMLADGKWPEADLRTTVLLDGSPSPRLRGKGRDEGQPMASAASAASQPRRPGKARIVSYRNTEVILEAESPDGGWVVLNDLWHPWWMAEVDGHPAKIERANVLFRAVAVPPGRHVVRFVFRPFAGAWRQLTGAPAR